MWNPNNAAALEGVREESEREEKDVFLFIISFCFGSTELTFCAPPFHG